MRISFISGEVMMLEKKIIAIEYQRLIINAQYPINNYQSINVVVLLAHRKLNLPFESMHFLYQAH